jgi:hypothetical protein
MNKFLSHYTNADGLFSIIESNSFWVSKSEFMNDPGEIKYARSLYDQEMQNYKTEELKLFDPMITWIDGILKVNDIFILSLTKEEDSLSLWERYGKGFGYSLKIDIDIFNEELTELNKLDSFKGFFEVNYGQGFQNDVVKKLLKDYIVSQKMNINFPLENETTSAICFKILDSIFAFKHISYKDEQEVRGIFSLPNLNSKFVVNDVWLSNIKFRPQNNKILPFIEKKLKSFRWLKGITLGPLNKDSRYKDGLELYLKSKGLNVEIIESCAPYRT